MTTEDTRYGQLEAEAGNYVDGLSREKDLNDTLLDNLSDAAEKEIEKKVIYEVDPTIRSGGWRLEFNAVISERELKTYTRFGGGGKAGTDLSKVENAKATAYCLVEKNTGVFNGSTRMKDTDGDWLTVTSVEWLVKVGKQTEKNFNAIQALINFLGDAQVIRMGSALMSAAGYNDQMEAVDPTFG